MSKYNRQKTRVNQTQDDADDDPSNESFVLFGTEFPEPTEKERRQGIEDPGKFQPVWNQQVTDEKGRRRFHGAFTGGFSAGYYNSVGSKEGWQPATFVSSRNTRQEKKSGARPEDFMDEEDLEEIANARKLVATEEFDLIGSTERDLAKKKELENRAETEGGLLGAQAFQDFVVPSKDPIGVKLLRRMGWKPGQGVGARISAAKRRKLVMGGSESESEDELDENISFAPRDSTIIVFAQKRDTFGLGFDPYRNVPDISVIKRSREEKSMASSTGKDADYNKAGFGIGVLDDDDDDDVYTNFSNTGYSRELNDDYDIEERLSMGKRQKTFKAISESRRRDNDRTSTTRSGHDGRAPLYGFSYGKQDALQEKWFPPVQVPADYKPIHIFKEPGPVPSTTETDGRQQRPDMSFEERGNLLGEKPIAPRSVFDYVSSKSKDSLDNLLSGITRSTTKIDKSRLHEIPRIDKKAALTALRGFLPFGENLKKQARYRAYLEGQAGLLQDDGSPVTSMDIPESLSYDEAMKELDDFGKAARIFRPISGMMSSRFTSASETVTTSVQPHEGGLKTESQWKQEKEKREELEREKSRNAPKIESQEAQAAAMKMFGQLTRKTKAFYPSRLVCKRFNVKNPHPDQQADDAAGRRTNAGGKQPLSKESVSSMMNNNTLDEFTIPSEFSNDPTMQAVIPKPSERSHKEQAAVEKSVVDMPSNDTKAKDEKPLDYERPSMDIFKAIFENSDDDDEDDDEEDEIPLVSTEKFESGANIGSAMDEDNSDSIGPPLPLADDDDSVIGPPLPPSEMQGRPEIETNVTNSKPVFRPMFKKRTQEGSNKDDRPNRHVLAGPMSFASEEHVVEPFSSSALEKSNKRQKTSRHESDDAAESSSRSRHHHKRDPKKKKRKSERSDSREKRHKKSKKRRRDHSENEMDEDAISQRLIYDDSLWVEKPPVAPAVTPPTKTNTRPKAYDMW